MRQPQHLSHDRERELDRLHDLSLATAALERAVAQGGREGVEACCRALEERLSSTTIPLCDQDEIRATLGLIRAQARFGVRPRLRKFLRPLVAALETQLEEAERDL
jgi:hypothetical protein